MNKLLFISVYVLFVSFIGYSQINISDLKSISNLYANETLSIDIDVKIYRTKNDLKGELLGTAYFKKKNDNYYSRFLRDEVINLGAKGIIINHSTKTVQFFKKQKNNTEKIKNKSFNFEIDTLLALTDTVIYSLLSDGSKYYQFYTKNSEIVRTDIELDPTSNLLKKIVYYYAESTNKVSYDAYKIELIYKSIDRNLVDSSYFLMSRYFSDNNRMILSSKFKDYRLIILNN